MRLQRRNSLRDFTESMFTAADAVAVAMEADATVENAAAMTAIVGVVVVTKVAVEKAMTAIADADATKI